MRAARKMIPAALVCVLMVAGACGEEADVDEEYRPAGSRALIPDDLLEQLEDAGAVVYLGDQQPSIAGTYLFNDYEVVFTDSDTWPATTNWCHDLITYTAGDDPETYVSASTSPNCDSSSAGQMSYISGADGCFTLYSETTFEFEGCTGAAVGVFSACVANNGDFEDPLFADIVTLREGESCAGLASEGRILGEGEIGIVRQADRVAEKVE